MGNSTSYAAPGGPGPAEAFTLIETTTGKTVEGFSMVFDRTNEFRDGKVVVHLKERDVLVDLSKDITEVKLSDSDRQLDSTWDVTLIPSKNCLKPEVRSIPFSQIKTITFYIKPKEAAILSQIKKYHEAKEALISTCYSIDESCDGDCFCTVYFSPGKDPIESVKNAVVLGRVLERAPDPNPPDYDGLDWTEAARAKSSGPFPVHAIPLIQDIQQFLKSSTPDAERAAKLGNELLKKWGYWIRCNWSWATTLTGTVPLEVLSLYSKERLKSPQLIEEALLLGHYSILAELPLEWTENVDRLVKIIERQERGALNFFPDLPLPLQENPRIVQSYLKRGGSVRVIPKRFLLDPQMILIALKANGENLSELSAEQKDNAQYVRAAALNSPAAIYYAGPRQKDDRETVLFALRSLSDENKRRGACFILESASSRIKDDEEVVKEAFRISSDSDCLNEASSRVRKLLEMNSKPQSN